MYAYVNGKFIRHEKASVHIEDRGFQFADGVYEVFAVMDGKLADAKGHFDRLARSLKELRIKQPISRVQLKTAMMALVKRNGLSDAVIYLQITRGVAPRAFGFPEKATPTVVITAKPFSFGNLTPRTAITVPDIRWKRRDIKTTGLLAQVFAKQAALDAGAYDAWMVDDKGYVTEASAANAWIVTKKGELVTRPTGDILKGVTRSALQKLCKENNIKLVERAFTPKEVYAAREAFTTAASALITPIVKMDGKKIGDGKVGQITRKVLDIYLAYARSGKQLSWGPK